MHPADGVAAALVLYNNLANLVPGFARRYVAVNLAATAALVLATRAAGLPLSDMAALPDRGRPVSVLRGAGIGLLRGAPLGSLFLLAAAMPRTRPHVADQRMASDPEAGRLTLPQLAMRTLVRIPLGTALAEEVAFRGVLQALAEQRTTPWRAALRTNLWFGLWHVVPTLHAVAANRPGWHADRRATAAAVAGGIATTFAGGMLLSWVRTGGGLPGAVMGHAITNAAAAIAGWAALGPPTPESAP